MPDDEPAYIYALYELQLSSEKAKIKRGATRTTYTAYITKILLERSDNLTAVQLKVLAQGRYEWKRSATTCLKA